MMHQEPSSIDLGTKFNQVFDPVSKGTEESNYYEILGVAPYSSASEIEAAFAKQKQNLREPSSGLYSIMSSEEQNETWNRVVEAYRNLSDVQLRDKYNRKLGFTGSEVDQAKAESSSPPPSPRHGVIHAAQCSREEIQKKFLTLIENAERIDGATLKELRQICKVSIDELYQATKVNKQFLAALEDNQFDGLPGIVYTKGFLRACLKYMNVPQSEYIVGEFAKLIAETCQDQNKKK